MLAPPQKIIPILIPKTYEFYLIWEKNVFAGVVKLRCLRQEDFPGLSNDKDPYKTDIRKGRHRDGNVKTEQRGTTTSRGIPAVPEAGRGQEQIIP